MTGPLSSRNLESDSWGHGNPRFNLSGKRSSRVVSETIADPTTHAPAGNPGESPPATPKLTRPRQFTIARATRAARLQPSPLQTTCVSVPAAIRASKASPTTTINCRIFTTLSGSRFQGATFMPRPPPSRGPRPDAGLPSLRPPCCARDAPTAVSRLGRAPGFATVCSRRSGCLLGHSDDKQNNR